MWDSDHTQGGESGTAHPEFSTGAHRGSGRHRYNFSRSIQGASTEPLANQAQPTSQPSRSAPVDNPGQPGGRRASDPPA